MSLGLFIFGLRDVCVEEGDKQQEKGKTTEEEKQKEITFPTLHIENRVWKVWVDGCKVFHSYGVENGKFQTTSREYGITNKGKKNQMLGSETATSKAERDWSSQLDKGYKPYDSDVEGMEMYRRVMLEKEKNGGSNYTQK